MKRSLLLMALMALLLVMAGCIREKEYARPAVYGKIYCTNSNPRVGDTVILKVEVPDAGNRIYHADYYWKCGDQFKQTVRKTAPDNSKTITEAPTFKWVFKKSGSFTVTMNAKFNFSMTDANGALIGGASASGTIKINP
jgi:hypothetical protein